MAKSIRKRINPFKFENLLKLLFIAVATVMILSACSVRQAQKTLLNSEGVKGAHVGIAIYNDSKEQWLSKYQSDHYFTPASNVKILATYLGLQFLGDSLPGWKMAENADTLFLMPLGDPSFMHPEFKYQPVVDIIKNTNKQVVIVGNNQDQFEIFGSGWSWADYAEDYQPERSRMPIYGNVVHFYQSNKKLEAIKPFYFFKDIVDLGKAEEKNWSRSRTGNRFFTTNENNKSKYFQVPFSQEDMPMVKALELLNDTLGKKISFQKQSTLPATSYKTIKTVPTDSLLKIMMLRSDNFYADQIVLMASEQLFGKMDDAALLDSTKKLFFADLPQKMLSSEKLV
jgi:D-alanyl-D-alanine carboxypeptidase/D-alanyl-D-alanine-endopeptidase (penicillin-binding protein 4)